MHEDRNAAFRCPEHLRQMADLYEERSRVYKANHFVIGNVMAALFPDGMVVKTPDEWTRLYFFMLKQVKVSRYVQQWDNGGHEDSLDDDIVYTSMLQMNDRLLAMTEALEEAFPSKPEEPGL